MLVLGRRAGQRIYLIDTTTNEKICTINVNRIYDEHVELAFDAPRSIKIIRDELSLRDCANGKAKS